MIMTLFNKKNGYLSVLVDDSDAELISKYKWCISDETRAGDEFKRLYVAGWEAPRRKGATLLKLHRLIVGANPGEIVDHINGDSLDNRRINLRIVTHGTNMRNCRKRKAGSSIYKGVDLTAEGKWRSRIYYAGRQVELGHFTTELEAVRPTITMCARTGWSTHLTLT